MASDAQPIASMPSTSTPANNALVESNASTSNDEDGYPYLVNIWGDMYEAARTVLGTNSDNFEVYCAVKLSAIRSDVNVLFKERNIGRIKKLQEGILKLRVSLKEDDNNEKDRETIGIRDSVTDHCIYIIYI